MTHRATTAVVLALALLTPTFAAEGPAGLTTSPFNGKNLDGWVVTGCEAVAEDGMLVLKSGNGLVRSEHRYGDFVLELQWRARDKNRWDSGIYFRCEDPPEGRPWPRRYQANLLKGREGDVGGLKGATGGSRLVKPGAWNRFKLTVIGTKAELEINGKPAWKADGLDAPQGYIGLQAEVPGGGVFEFKDIRITELGYKSLFNGKDLTGWEGGSGDAAKCWQVEDGTLMCTGQRGPWLRSKEQYGDFNLRLEYKLQPGGNSGVYLRVPRNGDHRGKSKGQKEAGVEIQVLDDKAKKYAKLAPYQYCGSVYAIAPSTKHVGREPGRWNSLEMNCQGTHYRVIHNGVVIVDAQEKEFPDLKERLLKGYLGLQNHSTKVWFRNVRIGPPMEEATTKVSAVGRKSMFPWPYSPWQAWSDLGLGLSGVLIVSLSVVVLFVLIAEMCQLAPKRAFRGMNWGRFSLSTSLIVSTAIAATVLVVMFLIPSRGPRRQFDDVGNAVVILPFACMLLCLLLMFLRDVLWGHRGPRRSGDPRTALLRRNRPDKRAAVRVSAPFSGGLMTGRTRRRGRYRWWGSREPSR